MIYLGKHYRHKPSGLVGVAKQEVRNLYPGSKEDIHVLLDLVEEYGMVLTVSAKDVELTYIPDEK